MAQINLSSLNDKIQKYINSTQGKAKANNASKQKSSYAEMNKTAEILCETIVSNMPDSISKKFQGDKSSWMSEPILSGNQVKIEIIFPKDLIHRNSLYGEKYSNGVDNIVALLNNGYHAKKYVFGYWNTANKNVRSIKDRKATHFMQKAINQFNRTQGSVQHCKAELNDKYK